MTTALKELGAPAAVNSLKELEDAYRQAFTLAGRCQAVVLSFWQTKHRKAVIVMMAFMFGAVPLASWALSALLKAPWLGGVNAVERCQNIAEHGIQAGRRLVQGPESFHIVGC